MKIKKKSKVKKKQPKEVAADPKEKIPKAYMLDDDSDDESSTRKLPKLDDDDNNADGDRSYDSDSSSSSRSRSRSRSPKPVPEPPLPVGVPPPEMNVAPEVQAAIMAAKAKIESQMSQLPPIPVKVSAPASSNLNNPTWLTDYNFPAVLSRCKFPKTQDALHELTTNRY